MMEIDQRQHLGWVDILRIIACALMVISHACDGFVSQFDTNRSAFLTGALTGSFARPSVPLFAMITGVLIFPVRHTMMQFYKKRIGRIIVPLIFWSIVSPLLFFLYFNYIYPGTLNPSIDLANHTLGATFSKIVLFFINFNYDTTPLWYLYMLIGLYLVIPIVAVWLEKASKKELQLVLLLWGITLVLPYVEMVAPFLGYKGNYGSMAILGESFWNKYGTFYYFGGFLGYLLMGHYLVKYPLNWSIKKIMVLAVPLFLIGYAITGLGFLLTQHYFSGNYMYLEIVWYFTGINVAMMTVAIFLVIQKVNLRPTTGLANFASHMFGIYLMHYVFVQMVYDLFVGAQLPAIVRILLIAVIAFFISYGVTWMMKRNKLTDRFVS